MKVYIVRELQEYKIYKVDKLLIKEFEASKKDNIVAEGKSIAEVIVKFDAIDKSNDLTFDAALKKFTAVSRETEIHKADQRKQRIKLK